MGFADEVDRRAAEFATAGEAAEREAARQREQGAAAMRAIEAFHAEAREALDLPRARGYEPEPASRMFEPRPRGTHFLSLGIEAPVRATPDGGVTIAGREFLVSSVARYLAR